ncbi:MAG: hypothetical protein ACE5OY_00875 [Candidatus Bathyarchaeia archaeon]
MTLIKETKVIRLLEHLLDGKIKRIAPTYDPSVEGMYRYSDIDAILENPSEETKEILNDLFEQGILKREFHDKLFQCPECGSPHVKPSPSCPNCKSHNLSKSQLIEHLTDGHVDQEENFRTENGRFVCPKCGRELKQIGVDYQRLGLLYRCRDCGEIFGHPDSAKSRWREPVNEWRCMKCHSTFSRMELREEDAYAYTLDEAARDKLLIELRPKRQIEEYLKDHGYGVLRSGKVRGVSGVGHEFDLFAERKSGTFHHRIAIDIARAEKEVGLEEVFKLYTKTRDVGVHEAILIAIPKAIRDALLFAKRYKLKILEAPDFDQALGALKRAEERKLIKLWKGRGKRV